jgi:hypothetical protein
MAVVFNWHRGARAALAEAIRDLDERLAAVELLSVGTLVSATTVAASASFPSPWVQDSLPAYNVAATAAVPSVTVRGAASYTTTAVAGVAAVPAPTVTVP